MRHTVEQRHLAEVGAPSDATTRPSFLTTSASPDDLLTNSLAQVAWRIIVRTELIVDLVGQPVDLVELASVHPAKIGRCGSAVNGVLARCHARLTHRAPSRGRRTPDPAAPSRLASIAA